MKNLTKYTPKGIFEVVVRIALLAMVVTTTSARSGELEERVAVRKQAEAAYRTGDFDSLDRQHSAYSDFLGQRTPSGASKMTLFLDGIDDAKRDNGEAERQQDIERTKGWVTEHKGSPLAYVLHANALLSYGGYFRGDGLASSVPPQAWKIYDEYIQRAARYLVENQAIASRSTSWYTTMLNIARLAGWPQDIVQRFFEEGIKLDSTDYRLYRNVLEYLLPKWHGDAKAIDIFINAAVLKAPPEYGSELYARLYSAAGETQFARRLYADSLINWVTMREALELWYRRFPTDWNKNILAYNACIAGDKLLAKQLLGEIGGQPQWEIWQPRAKATFDTCVRWAADPDAEPKAPRKPPAAAASGKMTQRHLTQGVA